MLMWDAIGPDVMDRRMPLSRSSSAPLVARSGENLARCNTSEAARHD
jgi:hypothetical protein